MDNEPAFTLNFFQTMINPRPYIVFAVSKASK